jgi:hypothetical protein
MACRLHLRHGFAVQWLRQPGALLKVLHIFLRLRQLAMQSSLFCSPDFK